MFPYMEEKKSLINIKAMLVGFVSGGLLSAPFSLNADILLKLGVFVYGILALLDTFIPSKEEEYAPVISIIGVFLGFAVSFIFPLNGLYILFVILVASVFYLIKAYKRLKHPRKQKTIKN